jgi:hypothetical protein
MTLRVLNMQGMGVILLNPPFPKGEGKVSLSQGETWRDFLLAKSFNDERYKMGR